jgi:phosphoglycerol transferase MdoB-like AlkP superfamily enzyme
MTLTALPLHDDRSHVAASVRGWWLRVTLTAAVYAAAGAVLILTEYGPFAIVLSFLALALLIFTGIAIFGRPGIAAALSLALMAALIALSQFKYGILQLTLTFLDFLIIDSATFSFMSSIFPSLRGQLALAALLSIPVLWLIWRLDPFRIRRSTALTGAAASVVAIVALSIAVPEQPWEPFQGVNHISNLARSGVASASQLASGGWLEAAAKSPGETPMPVASAGCAASARRPHIIMLLDESSFDIRAAPGIKVPAGYGDLFKSIDGRQRTFVAEATGGPTWYTEFNVLSGLSVRSFGKMKFYVTRIAAGRIARGLPMALRHCGYRTFSLYPTYGNFLDAREYQHSTGIDRLIDMAEMGATEDMQPDKFYFDHARSLIARERQKQAPLFTFLYLTANHFPWTSVYRPDLTPNWQAPGNTPEIDEYIRRQMMTAQAYKEFVARLKSDFPDDSFLIVRFGDHQPAISHKLIEPRLAPRELANRLMSYDPRYYATYYAIDAVNFEPVKSPAVMDTVDAAYLPLVIQEAAGIPLDPSFEEQKKIMLRCKGLFYACKDGAEARRFNRLLIDAGIIKNL